MLTYVIPIRGTDGTPSHVGDVTPAWAFLKKLDDGTDITQPELKYLAPGIWTCRFDPEVNGDCVGQVDLGTAVTTPERRFIDVCFYRSDSRMIFNLDQPVSSIAPAIIAHPPRYRFALGFDPAP